jgi:xanthine dehydrogenase accessory factor
VRSIAFACHVDLIIRDAKLDNWLDSLFKTISDGDPKVLVTVAQARGSVPREAGAKLLVGNDCITGSIGGGNLEFQAIAAARRLLAGSGDKRRVTERVALGPSLGQCCGGDVTLLYERLGTRDLPWIEEALKARQKIAKAALVTRLAQGQDSKVIVFSGENCTGVTDNALVKKALEDVLEGRATDRFIKASRPEKGSLFIEHLSEERPDVWLFGAGHVGRALVQVLATLPFRVFWVDSRAEEFPGELPGNVEARPSPMPLDDVVAAKPGAYFLVMTHSHPLDLAICEAVLKRHDFRYLGLIGSSTKKARFLRQLRESGLPDDDLEGLVCPIGLPGIGGKKPGEIAVAVAAQLLQVSGSKSTDL